MFSAGPQGSGPQGKAEVSVLTFSGSQRSPARKPIRSAPALSAVLSEWGLPCCPAPSYSTAPSHPPQLQGFSPSPFVLPPLPFPFLLHTLLMSHLWLLGWMSGSTAAHSSMTPSSQGSRACEALMPSAGSALPLPPPGGYLLPLAPGLFLSSL